LKVTGLPVGDLLKLYERLGVSVAGPDHPAYKGSPTVTFISGSQATKKDQPVKNISQPKKADGNKKSSRRTR